jgi:hypothetical protein
MDAFFNNKIILEKKPEYGSKEYNRQAQRKHYETKGGREKAREYGKVKYYRCKYGRDIVDEYQQKYGDNYITMLKIDKLKHSLSDSSSEGSNENLTQIIKINPT